MRLDRRASGCTSTVLSMLVLASSCGRSVPPTGQPSDEDQRILPAPPAPVGSEAPPGVGADSGPLLPALGGTWLEQLELPNGEIALVSVPLGTRQPRPIMVAVHGAGDRPEWACGGWRGVTDAYPFIVCPRGAPMEGGKFYWRSTAQLRSIIDAALVAMHERYGPYLADGPMLYAGFSAGVIYGAALVRDEAGRFPTVMLSEGGYEQLSDPTFASRFRKNGGRKVLLGCSTGGACLARLGEARRLLTQAGVDARVNDAGIVGHNLNAEVVRSLQKDWPWLVEGIPAWSPSDGDAGSIGTAATDG